MSDQTQSDDIVTINGKQYSKFMAEQTALDIEYVNARKPALWALGGNSALTVGSVSMLSFAHPIQHGYLIDISNATEEVTQIANAFGRSPHLKEQPSMIQISLPSDGQQDLLEKLRTAHESAIEKNIVHFKICHRWQEHSIDRLADLVEIFGRPLAAPIYPDEFTAKKLATDLSPAKHLPSDLKNLNPSLLQSIAQDIELADGINRNSWSLYWTKSNGVVLIIEQITAFFLDGNSGNFFVMGSVDDTVFEQFDHSSLAHYKSIEGLTVPATSIPQLTNYLLELSKQHEDGVTELAKRVKTKTQRANEHQPETLNALSELVGRTLPQPGYWKPSKEKRYWKISPGDGGKYWPEFQARSLIAMHWKDELVDVSTFPDTFPDFKKMAKEKLDVGPAGAKSLWDFSKIMQVGDKVLAYGNKTILGRGTVAGGYELVDDVFEYPHRRLVKWEPFSPRSTADFTDLLQKKLMKFETLFELTEQEFSTATLPQTPHLPPIKLIQTQFRVSGLHYTREQLATFYTALQTKGFVVLSGISGTGKSKIATGFVDMLPSPSSESISSEQTSTMQRIEIKPDMKKNRRVTIPVRMRSLIPPMELGNSYPVALVINGSKGSGKLWYRSLDGRDSYLLNFHQNVSAAVDQWEIGQSLYVDFVLDPDGERVQEIRLTKNPVAPTEQTPAPGNSSATSNHLFLSVRPDWRDSTSLLGYYNPLTQTYEWTEFLRFLIRAQESYLANDGLAWFVILDEMNLAHVEYYFADLLSVIESGRDTDGWTREPIRLTYPDTLDDEVPPHELRLPPNLYVIGTVNMDETTHAFSPKVLDRAFTIELSDVDFATYQLGNSLTQATIDDSQKLRLLREFTRFDPATGQSTFARISKLDIAEIVDQEPRIRTYLQSLNLELIKHRFHFGYRIFDEIAQYLSNNQRNGMMEFIPAFDQAVFMKVLPKFSGSRTRLRAPLLSLLAWTRSPEEPALSFEAVLQLSLKVGLENASVADSFIAESPFKIVAARAIQMLSALENDGFVSFG